MDRNTSNDVERGADDERQSYSNGEDVPLLQPSNRVSPTAQQKDTTSTPQPAMSIVHEDSPQRVLVGLLMFAASTIFLTLMGTCAKLLARRGMPVFETVFARSFSMFVLSMPFLVKSKANPVGNRRGLLLLRGLLGFGSVSSIFWTVKFLPLSDATVLSFLAPLVVALTAPVLLKEPISRLALLAVPVCFSGVILVARPAFIFHGKSLNTIGVVIGVAQACFSATAKMSVRALRSSEQDAVIVFWMSTTCMVLSGAACCILPNHFRMPLNATEWLLLAGAGLSGFGNQVALTAGLRRAPATPAIAMSYLSVVWGLGIGATVFAERPTLMSLAGATLICSCTGFLSMSQSGKKSAKNTPPPSTPRIPTSTSVKNPEAEPLLISYNEGSDPERHDIHVTVGPPPEIYTASATYTPPLPTSFAPLHNIQSSPEICPTPARDILSGSVLSSPIADAAPNGNSAPNTLYCLPVNRKSNMAATQIHGDTLEAPLGFEGFSDTGHPLSTDASSTGLGYGNGVANLESARSSSSSVVELQNELLRERERNRLLLERARDAEARAADYAAEVALLEHQQQDSLHRPSSRISSHPASLSPSIPPPSPTPINPYTVASPHPYPYADYTQGPAPIPAPQYCPPAAPQPHHPDLLRVSLDVSAPLLPSHDPRALQVHLLASTESSGAPPQPLPPTQQAPFLLREETPGFHTPTPTPTPTKGFTFDSSRPPTAFSAAPSPAASPPGTPRAPSTKLTSPNPASVVTSQGAVPIIGKAVGAKPVGAVGGPTPPVISAMPSPPASPAVKGVQ